MISVPLLSISSGWISESPQSSMQRETILILPVSPRKICLLSSNHQSGSRLSPPTLPPSQNLFPKPPNISASHKNPQSNRIQPYLSWLPTRFPPLSKTSLPMPFLNWHSHRGVYCQSQWQTMPSELKIFDRSYPRRRGWPHIREIFQWK